MSKPLPNSLFARLKPQQRDQVLHWLIVEGKALQWVKDQLDANFGVNVSLMSVSRFLSAQGLSWRLDRAKEAAAVAANVSPKDLDELKRKGLAQQEFQKVYSDLTVKEVVALKRCELAAAKLEVDKRRLTLLEAKLKSVEQVATDSKLTAQEQATRIREIFKK